MNLKAWEDFCDELKNLGSIIENNAPDTLSRNEGYRYLLRLLRLASEMHFEHSFPNHASFYSLSNETAKIGGDNPDNVYFCLLYTSPSPRDRQKSRMPSSA